MIAAFGCASTTSPPGDRDLGGAADAAPDVAPDATRACALDATLDSPCLGDAECDDGCFCNGAERCSGGLCARGMDPCDDEVDCTLSACDEANALCLAPTLDDTFCDDAEPCNGAETCTTTGCASGDAPTCDDGDACTVDSCTPGSGCTFDDFADPCAPPPGCMVELPLECCGPEELCANGRDDDCDGLTDVDDDDCPTANDTCATAQLLPGSGTYRFSTRDAAFDRTISCSVSGSDPIRDVVFRLELTETSDLRAFVEGDGVLELRGAGGESVCVGDFAADRDFLQCFPNLLELEHLAPGTYWLLYATGFEGLLDLLLTVTPSAPRTCVPEIIPPEGRLSTRIFRGDDAAGPSCGAAPTAPDRCYALTLTEPRSVRTTLRTTEGIVDIAAAGLELSGTASVCETQLLRPIHVLVGNVPAGTLDFVAEPLERVATQHQLDVEVLDPVVCDACDEACALSPGERALLDLDVMSSDATSLGCPARATGQDAFFAFATTVSNERVDLEVDAPADFAYALRAGSVACPFTSPTVCGAGVAGTPLSDRLRVPMPGRHLLVVKTVSRASGTLDVRVTPTGISLPAP